MLSCQYFYLSFSRFILSIDEKGCKTGCFGLFLKKRRGSMVFSPFKLQTKTTRVGISLSISLSYYLCSNSFKKWTSSTHFLCSINDTIQFLYVFWSISYFSFECFPYQKSWVGCLLTDSEFFIIFAENSQIPLKISAIPILLTFMYLVGLNLLKNNQLNSLSICHIFVHTTNFLLCFLRLLFFGLFSGRRRYLRVPCQ